MKKRCYLFVVMTMLLGCKKTEEETIYDSTGVATKLPHIWKSSISDNGELTQVSVNVNIPISDGNFIVGGGKDGDDIKLIKINSDNGNKIWEWNDRLSLLTAPNIKDPISISPDKFALNDNRLFFSLNTSSYCLDVNTGNTLWKNKVLVSRIDGCRGLGNKYFSFGSEITSNGGFTSNIGNYIYEGNLLDANMVKKILKPNYVFEPTHPTNTFNNGIIKACLPYIYQKDTLLSVLFIDPDIGGSTYRTVAGLFNYSQKKWIYERKILNQPAQLSNITHSILVKDKFYHSSGKSLHCNDVLTGESLWVQYFDQGFGSSRFIIEGDKMYAACDDRVLYCININSGQIIWKEQNAGGCSPISYLNGVLYFLGGDAKLHAVDADTGKHLWKLNSPDATKNSGAFFYGLCAAVPGKNGQKGRVIGTTGLNAYCFEAIR
jgi:outer membrane protein assembly factor BamB